MKDFKKLRYFVDDGELQQRLRRQVVRHHGRARVGHKPSVHDVDHVDLHGQYNNENLIQRSLTTAAQPVASEAGKFAAVAHLQAMQSVCACGQQPAAAHQVDNPVAVGAQQKALLALTRSLLFGDAT